MPSWPIWYRHEADYQEVEGSSPTWGNYFEIFFIFSLSLFRLKIVLSVVKSVQKRQGIIIVQ